MSTSGDVQYIRGCSVHQGDIMMHVGGYHDTMSTSGGHHEYIGEYHEYIRGCSVHQGDIMMHVGRYHDTMSTSGE